MGKLTTAKLRLAFTEATRPSTPSAGVMVKILLVSVTFVLASETPIGLNFGCAPSFRQKQPVKLQTKSSAAHEIVVRILDLSHRLARRQQTFQAPLDIPFGLLKGEVRMK